MSLIELIVIIAVVGLLVWAITTLVPMDALFKRAIIVIAIVGFCFYVLSAVGLLPHIHDIKIGK